MPNWVKMKTFGCPRQRAERQFVTISLTKLEGGLEDHNYNLSSDLCDEVLSRFDFSFSSTLDVKVKVYMMPSLSDLRNKPTARRPPDG